MSEEILLGTLIVIIWLLGFASSNQKYQQGIAERSNDMYWALKKQYDDLLEIIAKINHP